MGFTGWSHDSQRPEHRPRFQLEGIDDSSEPRMSCSAFCDHDGETAKRHYIEPGAGRAASARAGMTVIRGGRSGEKKGG